MPADPAQLEARLDILHLEGEYARTWDTLDAPGWADLFTSDGSFEMLESGDMAAVVVKGRDELIAFCERINARIEGLHLLHTPSLRVEGERARGWMHFEFRSHSRPGRKPLDGHVMGVYQIDYTRTADGWRIQRRIEKAVQSWTGEPSGSFFGVPRELGEPE